jgi:Tol biopolymer transport system component
VKGKPLHRWLSWKLLAGGAACFLALIGTAEHFFPVRQGSRGASGTIRLTSFSPELTVSAAAISPDGKTLAYANPAGIFLEETATKETRSLRTPAIDTTVSNLSWFPDGSRLLATGAASDAMTASVWLISAKGQGDPERIGAFHDGIVSPDGSRIALVRESQSVKELLLLPTGGGPLRRVAEIPEEDKLGNVFWSTDGQRLHFVVTRWNAQLRGNQGFIRSVNLATLISEEILTAANLSGDAIALSDGRLLYGQLLGANPTGSYGAELREVHLDAHAGKVAGDSVSLGRWTQQVAGLSSSADGRRVAFRLVLSQHSVYEGDLDKSGESLSRVRRLTFGQARDDFPRAWTPDSKAIFFDSNRNGKWEIFKQRSDQVFDEPYVRGSTDAFSPSMSPDGHSLLYLDRPREWHEPEPVRLMRVSAVQGFPQFVLQSSGYSEWGLRFECPRRSDAPCILAQRTGNEVLFRQFNPESGFVAGENGALRIPLAPNLRISWALAPDGSHLAWIVSDAPDATIHVVPFEQRSSEGREREIVLRNLSHLHALNWSPDGKGWYLTTRLPVSWKIIYASGIRTYDLWQGKGNYSPEPWPSPDGRHLAFSQLEQDSNVWMLQSF